MMLKSGDKVPAFSHPTDGGGELSLMDLKRKKAVLYFYPKDMTPGCTTEAENFRDRAKEFAKSGAVIVGISKDSAARHDKFKEKYRLPFILLSDEGGDLCERFGVWQEKSLYGRKFMGIVRSTFLIDEKGIVRQVWPKVKVKGHADEVLAALKAL